jgi:hypothetical protein
LTQAGRICGIISTIWLSVVLMFTIAWVTLMFTYGAAMAPPRPVRVAPVKPAAPAPRAPTGKGADNK